MHPVPALREQASSCAALGSPLYAGLLTHLADDVAWGGPTATVLAGHEDDPGPSALGLRLLGSVHRLVLAGRVPTLARFYPSVGGTWDDNAGARAFLDVLREQPDAVREWLDRAPQTNEVGRSAALVGGLLHLDDVQRLPVRLHEIGASGGLNLLAAGFRLCGADGDERGPADSPVVLDPAWHGGASPVPRADLRVREARGCDVRPVDAASPEGRLRLQAYVWPDQEHRLARLRGALELARRTPPVVLRQSAADFVDALELRDGALTVLWHSVMWQYLSRAEQQRIEQRLTRLGADATDAAPLAHLRLEPTLRDGMYDCLVQLTRWPGGERRVLGSAPPHGLPVTWEDTG